MVREKVEPALTAKEWARYLGRDLDDRPEWGNVVVSAEEVGARLGWSPRLLALANHALPDGHPLKLEQYDDIDLIDLFVRNALATIEEQYRDTHRGAPEYIVSEEMARWEQSAAPVRKHLAKLAALLPNATPEPGAR